MMRRNVALTLLATLTVLLWVSAGVQAEDAALRADLERALSEIKELRSEIASMKTDSNWQYRQELESALEEVPSAGAGGGGQVLLPAGWSVKPYGYIKLDLVWDDSANPAGTVCQR